MSAIERLRAIQQDLWRLRGASGVVEQHLISAYGPAWRSSAAEEVYGARMADAEKHRRDSAAITRNKLNLDDGRRLIEALRYLSALERLRRGLTDEEMKRLNLIANTAHHVDVEKYREGDEHRARLWIDQILANAQAAGVAQSVRTAPPVRLRASQRTVPPPGPEPQAPSPPTESVPDNAASVRWTPEQWLSAHVRHARDYVVPTVERALSDAYGGAWRGHVSGELRWLGNAELSEAAWMLKLFASDPALAQLVAAPQREAAIQLLQLIDAAVHREPLTDRDIASAARFTRLLARLLDDDP